ncbi:MAG: PEP-CTERM sorting domain-containing protein [Acidobacteriia bacterium]|nr:PEP-CTERM sorting domain-containing protein [Terriglobia bacterium]
MKTILSLFASMVLAAVGASAGVLVSFDNPSLTGSPGQTLIFTATLFNNGASTVFLNSDSLNLAGNSFTVTDQFFTTVPISLNAGMSVTGIELFDVHLNSPFTDPFGPYLGSYALLGGADGNAQDPLGQASFTVTAAAPATTPEPASAVLFATVVGALLARRLKVRPTRAPAGKT